MKRRHLITLFAGATASPMLGVIAGLAQQKAFVVGIFGLGSAASSAANRAGLHRGLSETGFVDGRNVIVVDRWLDDQYDRLHEVASDLVRNKVDVIVAVGNAIVASAALAATRTTPIVFANGSDPVRIGHVASMNRPGGNATGISFLVAALMPKKLEIIRELAPKAVTIATLVNPTNPGTKGAVESFQGAARSVNQQVVVLDARNDTEIEKAFETMARDGIGALVVSVDSFLSSRRASIAALAVHHRIAAIYSNRNNTESGGLVSYGDNRPDSFRLAGIYVGRILKGERPADLPVLQPTKFELVVNLRAAKAIGLNIPEAFLVRADEVIE